MESLMLLLIKYWIILVISTAFCSCNNNNLKIIRLPKNTVPIHYNIDFIIPQLEEVNSTFYGESNVNIEIRYMLHSISLHSTGLEINKTATTLTTVNVGTTFRTRVYKPIQHIHDNVTNILTLNFEKIFLPGSYILHMKFSGNISEIGFVNLGFMIFPYTHNERNGIMAATIFEPNGASRVFPCWDEPAFKATFNVSVMHPSMYSVLSNTPVREQIITKENGMILTHFATTPVMSTYLVAIVIIPSSDFVSVSYTDQINIWCRPSLISQVTDIHIIAEKILPFMIQYINYTEKVSKIDHVLIPNHPTNGMENWGLITYSELIIIYDDSKHSSRKRIDIATTVTRGFVQQWFGNLATPSWWTHLWLKDGLAVYIQTHLMNKIFQEWRVMDFFVIRTLQACLTVDVGTLNSVTLTLDNTLDDISQFSDEIYKKAPALLRMLHNTITDEVFRKGLIIYLTTHQYKSTTPDDLWSAMQSVFDESDVRRGGYRIKDVMDTWINQKGYPVVNVKTCVNSYEITLSQKCISDQEPVKCFNNQWWIPITFAMLINPDFSNTVPRYWLTPNRSIHLYRVSNDWIVVNVQQTGYYRVNYDLSNWQKIAYYLNSDNYTIIHVLNRAQIISDLFAFVLNDQISGFFFVHLIKYLYREKDYVVWHSMFPIIKRLWKFLYLPEAIYAKVTIMSLLSSLLRKIGFIENSHDNDIVKLTRIEAINWACNLGSKYCRDAAAVKLSQHLTDPEVYKFPEWQIFMYCVGLMAANRTTWDKILELYHKTKISSQILLEGLSCAEDPGLIINYLNIIAFNISLFSENNRYFAIMHILKRHSRNYLILNHVLNNFEIIRSMPVAATTMINLIISNIYSYDQIDKVKIFSERKFRDTYILEEIQAQIRNRKDMIEKDINTFKRQFY